ncbi:hypothetical protein ACN47E_000906 [Coniothyrium glycines]
MDGLLLRIAHIWGVAGAAFLSGYIACFSHAGVPTLSVAPIDTLVHEFKTMYAIGKASSPLVAITVTLCNAYSAYHASQDGNPSHGAVSSSTLLIAATICVPLIIPYTVLRMEPAVNRKLIALGAKVEKGAKAQDLGVREDEVRNLLKSWKGMNFVRAALVAAGACLTAIAVIA